MNLNFINKLRKCNGESLAYALREKLSYVYKYDSTVSGRCKYYSTSYDLGYYPFTVDTVTVDDHDELKLTYYSSSGSQAFPLVNSSSYIDGEYSAYSTITSGNGSNLCFTVLVGVKNSKTGDILSEVNFNINPFITEVPDIK